MFEFAFTEAGVENPTKEECVATERRTTVRLNGFKPDYESHCPKMATTVARRIVEHCLEYFVLDTCPKIMLHDEEYKTCLNLNRIFSSEMRTRSESGSFKIKDRTFRVTHLMVTSAQDNQHRLFFCAHKRAVRSEAITNKIANLVCPLKAEGDGKAVIYTGYVSGTPLDETVNSERTDFRIPKESEPSWLDELSWQDLMEASIEHAGDFLTPYTSPVKQAKEEQIRAFVQTKAPQYR